jgi:DNA-binding protein YbaB
VTRHELPEAPEQSVLGRLTAMRGDGTAADGLVRAGVDGTGDLVELVIEPRAMRLASSDLAREIRAAVSAARAEVAARLAESAAAAPAVAGPDVAALQQLLVEVDATARQRMDEFTRFAGELSARLGRS